MPNGHSTTIEVGGAVITSIANPVTLTVNNNRIIADNHLSVKVTREGVIIELWDDARNEYRESKQFLFSDYTAFSTPAKDER
jgi:hypothetical protein